MDIEKIYKVYSIAEALDKLAEYKQEIEILAGGTDVVVHIRENKNKTRLLLDVTSIDEMKNIEIKDNEISIGALATFTDIVKNDYIKKNVYGLWKAAKSVGSPQIRNMGTVGGNICNGSMAADTLPPLLALDALLTIKSKNNIRKVKLSEFFTEDGKTILNDDEMLVEITFEIIKNKELNIGFEKLGLRKALAISRISSAVFLDIDSNTIISNVRIASGSIGKTPLREYELEEFMKGKKLDEHLVLDTAAKFSKIVENRLSSRSSCEFKKEAIKGIFKNAVYSAIKDSSN